MGPEALQNPLRESGQNIVLIGMPGVGKSTVGVLLAKELGLSFLDTDLFIQAHEGKRLQEIIQEIGVSSFRALEERCILATSCRSHVIATGGSVVYSPQAIEHLGSDGILIYLALDLGRLKERLGCLDVRGVIRAPGQTLEELYAERCPLYQKYADLVIDCDGLNPDQMVSAIALNLPA